MDSLFEGINDIKRLQMELDANALHRMHKELNKQLNQEINMLDDTKASLSRMLQTKDDILNGLEEMDSDLDLHKKSLRLLSNESKPILFSIARQIRQIISYHSWLLAAVEVSKTQAYDKPESVFSNQSFVCDYNAGVLAAFIVGYNQLYDSLVFSEITRQAILAVNKNNITRENVDKIVMVLKVIERYQEQFKVESKTQIHNLIIAYTHKIKNLIAEREINHRLNSNDINKVFEKLIPSLYFIKNNFISKKDLPFPVTHPEYVSFSGDLNFNDIKNSTIFRVAAENLFVVDIERAHLTPPINLLRTSDFSGKPPLLAKHELYELVGANNHPIKF
ncbi:hypothetical protein [Aeromonas sobria]|uniref:hypothetical protein n=1 Tax=Aeromonas sobria TaxID=646 RepID=UPI00111603B1|nr:hypothetical protein [Aeromonas sobria]TNH81125.1 hypothetical protein CF140_14425 [Aeromonas sobria]